MYQICTLCMNAFIPFLPLCICMIILPSYSYFVYFSLLICISFHAYIICNIQKGSQSLKEEALTALASLASSSQVLLEIKFAFSYILNMPIFFWNLIYKLNFILIILYMFLQEHFQEYYVAVMPYIKVMSMQGKSNHRLLAKAMECITMIWMAVGKEICRKDCQEVII